jgi:hypothetical protein
MPIKGCGDNSAKNEQHNNQKQHASGNKQRATTDKGHFKL